MSRPPVLLPLLPFWLGFGCLDKFASQDPLRGTAILLL